MLELKHFIFFGAAGILVPAGILLSCLSRKIHDVVFVVVVFGTCMPHSLFGLPTDINFLSAEWYRGSTRGIEISYIDLAALVLLVASLVHRKREGRSIHWPPGLAPLLAYLAWCVITVVAFSDPKLFGVFELTKIIRGTVLFIAVAFYIRSPRELRIFVWALVGTIMYEGLVCLKERYVDGRNRTSGTLGHPNSLSMYCLQCLPIFIAAHFSKDASKLFRFACFLGFVATAGCVLLSISRTGFAVLVLISGVAFILSTGLKLSPRNLGLAALGLLIFTLMVAKSFDTIMTRLGGFDLQREYLSEEGDRGQYFRQAAPALAEYPVYGFGLNNWSWWIGNRYAAMTGFDSVKPYEIMGSGTGELEGTAVAHNIYLLTVAELGWVGLIFLMVMFLRWLWMSGSVMLSNRQTLEDSVRLGICLSLAGVMLQSWTEWEFRQTPMYFLGHAIMGVGSTLYFHRARKSKTASR